MQLRQERVLAHERERVHLGAREERAALVHGIRRLAVEHGSLVRVRVDEHLREREDRLLRAVRRHDLRVRVERDAEAALAPSRGSGAQLGEALGERIGRALGERVDERLPDGGVGRLVRIALAEVDHRDALVEQPPPRLLEPDERIGRHLRQRGCDADRHG